ncbi:class I adenylate-forming enzyme family protein [Saccharothrix obliqua]|uniref:class I adenylate-forming enzyme family protein n=1 Tax=Saccharothrix obliqua TaxID=2861747 RepID=UPI001C5EDBA1|nr:fatty acid--CoA ligase family protein [Saccharothrix obliqua]MBW4721794.1 fatty acid--CoA ligase family protein [Saccharothrix obliqua]
MGTTLDQVLADAGRDAAVIVAGDRLSASGLRTAGARLAEELANRFAQPRFLVSSTADAALITTIAVAAGHLGAAVLYLDPTADPGDGGVLLGDRPIGNGVRLGAGVRDCHALDRGPAAGVESLPADSVLFRTSGSTGAPRAVVKPFSRVLNDSRRIADALHGRGPEPVVSSVPVFHSYGFTHALLAGFLAGVATTYRAPTTLPAALAATVADTGARTLVGLPVQYQLIATTPPHRFAGLARAVSAGAPLPADAVRRIHADHAFTLLNAFGASEAGTITITDTADLAAANGIGEPLPGVRAEIDTSGELLTWTDALATGYLDGGVLRPLPLRDGWYRTGDLAERGPDGLRITGRVTDVINIAGRKTTRGRLESVLGGHPDVLEVQVVIALDETRGQVPVARVVSRHGGPVPDLLSWSRERLADFEVPRRVELCAELPRSATGKLLYRDER